MYMCCVHVLIQKGWIFFSSQMELFWEDRPIGNNNLDVKEKKQSSTMLLQKAEY